MTDDKSQMIRRGVATVCTVHTVVKAKGRDL